MKTLLLLLFLNVSAFCQQASDGKEVSRLIRAELLVVQLPEAAALEIQHELRDPKQVTAGQEKIIEMVRKKQATLVDWPVLTTKPGNRAVVENSTEIRYGSAYQPPKVVTLPPINPDPQKVERQEAGGEEASTKDRKVFGAVPTTFESRSAGVTLELEPNLAEDGRHIDAQLAPKHVHFLGFRRDTTEIAGGASTVVNVPDFETRKVSTNLTMQSGVPQLVGFFRLKKPEATVELFLVTLTILENGVPVK